MKKVAKIVFSILVYLFFAFCVFTLIITIASKRDETGAAELFGYQLRIVVSSSMEKCEETDVSDYKIKDIPVRSMVFVKSVPEGEEKRESFYASIAVGDVLTFRYVMGEQEIITHRVVGITAKDTGGYIIELAGDNKNAGSGVVKQTIDTSDTDSPNCILGRVTGKSYILGVLVTAIKSPIGMLLLIILPCSIIIVLEIIRIVNVVHGAKLKKEQCAMAEQTKEIEELKRQIAELQNESSAVEKNENKEE